MLEWQKEFDPLLDKIKTILLERRQTLAVAESVTAGHLQVMFSLAENAQQFFQGGMTTYNLGQKTRHLNVEPIRALDCNCVSENVAGEMANNITSLFLSDWGIGITGYASPVPEKNIHELFACYAIYFRGLKMAVETVTTEKDNAMKVRLVYTRKVLEHFLTLLQTGVYSPV